jgi:thiosulfate/3-mercaptopyruvate sulfurtransferase
MSDYAYPDSLVTTQWAADHLNDAAVRFVEVDVDTAAYAKGHIPGAIGWNWQTDLNDKVRRDIVDPEAFAELNRAAGIRRDDIVVFYGDNNNWFAAWAFWQLKIYGHADVRLMDGGRRKWLAEGRPLDLAPFVVPVVPRYRASEADPRLRARLPDVFAAIANGKVGLVDVRSPKEFTGELLSPPGLPETCQRGGHLPGAKSVPWDRNCLPDGTFKSKSELTALYAEAGIRADRPAIAYCRIGERSSYTWFALKYLVGLDDVRNYDGSWTEWGNLVGAPIERGEPRIDPPSTRPGEVG